MVEMLQKTFFTDFLRKLLRVAIVAGVIAVAMVLAGSDPGIEMLLVVTAVPILIVGALLLTQWPPLGFILLILMSNLLALDIPPLGVMAIFIVLINGLWVVDMIIVKQEIRFVPSQTITPLIFFSAVVLLSFIMGQLPWFSVSQVDIGAQIAGVAIFLLSFSLFILGVQQIRELKWLKWMVYLFIVTGAPSIIIGLQVLPGYRTLNQLLFHPRTTGGSLYWVWLVTLTIALALFNRNLPRKYRFLLGLLAFGAMYISLGRNRSWTSGWAPIFVSLITMIWVARPRWALPLSMMGGGAFIVFFQQIYDIVFIGDNAYSAETRFAAWEVMWEIIKVNPILGLGPANYYNYTTLFPILGWYVEFNSHNNFVDIVAQTGILGLLCFFWFFIVVAWRGYHLRNKVPEGGFSQAFVYGAMGALAGSVAAGMLGDWILPFYYNIGIFGLRSSYTVWLFLGGMIALEQMVKDNVPLD